MSDNLDSVKFFPPRRRVRNYRKYKNIKIIAENEIGSELEEIWSIDAGFLNVIWNNYAVNIDLRYEFSYMFDEFLSFYEWILSKKSEPEKFDLCVDTFNLSIVAEKVDRVLIMNSDWHCVGINEEYLTKRVCVDVIDYSKTLLSVLIFVEKELASHGKIYPRLSGIREYSHI